VRGERQGAKAKSTYLKEKRIRENMPMVDGSTEEVAACAMDGLMQGKLGRSGWIRGEDSNKN
jgi:hypothetical protein